MLENISVSIYYHEATPASPASERTSFLKLFAILIIFQIKCEF